MLKISWIGKSASKLFMVLSTEVLTIKDLHDIINSDNIIITECGRVFIRVANKTRSKNRVYNLLHGNFVETGKCIDSRGYLIGAYKKIQYKTHRLVALIYVDGHSDYRNIVNHKDGNKRNNNPNNLEWVTCGENIRHSWDSGLSKRTDEMNESARKTTVDKTPLEKYLDINYKGQVPNLKLMLKARNLSWDDFTFITTDRNKSGHRLGYLVKKQNHK